MLATSVLLAFNNFKGESKMSFNCHFCGIIIFPSEDGRGIFYEDDGRTIIHDCSGLKNKKPTDYKLLRQTISRVSELEHQVTELHRKL